MSFIFYHEKDPFRIEWKKNVDDYKLLLAFDFFVMPVLCPILFLCELERQSTIFLLLWIAYVFFWSFVKWWWLINVYCLDRWDSCQDETRILYAIAYVWSVKLRGNQRMRTFISDALQHTHIHTHQLLIFGVIQWMCPTRNWITKHRNIKWQDWNFVVVRLYGVTVERDFFIFKITKHATFVRLLNQQI